MILGIPESEVDGTAMLTEEASLVVDGANSESNIL